MLLKQKKQKNGGEQQNRRNGGKRRAEERGDKQRREKGEADVHGRAVDVGVLHKSSLQQNSYDIFVACGFKVRRYGKGVCFAIRVIP